MSTRFIRHVAAAAMLALSLAAAVPALGQATATPLPTLVPTQAPPPNANISFPPPVYVLRGEFEIRGSANLPMLTNYFIEFRPLDGPLVASDGTSIYFPVTIPSTQSVNNDVLGVWDTTLVPDGVYELRLTVNVTGVAPRTHVVGPLRVENNPPPFSPNAAVPAPGQATALPPQQPPPTAAPATPTTDPTPTGTVTTGTANVRGGDGTNYPILGSLAQGQTVTLVGISNRGTNWYQVRLPSGQLGWMAPSVISISGNAASLPLVAPPPPPATPTFTPIPPTPTPATTADYIAGNIFLNPVQPVCNQPFTVSIDVANLGTVALPGGFVQVTDVRAADNQLPTTATVAFPVINPGQTLRVDVPLTVSTFFNEVHRITIAIDPANLLIETNEGNNVRTIDYTLAQGACG
jgi:hypothetical protein